MLCSIAVNGDHPRSHNNRLLASNFSKPFDVPQLRHMQIPTNVQEGRKDLNHETTSQKSDRKKKTLFKYSGGSCVITQRREAQKPPQTLTGLCSSMFLCGAGGHCARRVRECVMLTPKQEDHRRGGGRGGGACGRGPTPDWWISEQWTRRTSFRQFL